MTDTICEACAQVADVLRDGRCTACADAAEQQKLREGFEAAYAEDRANIDFIEATTAALAQVTAEARTAEPAVLPESIEEALHDADVEGDESLRAAIRAELDAAEQRAAADAEAGWIERERYLASIGANRDIKPENSDVCGVRAAAEQDEPDDDEGHLVLDHLRAEDGTCPPRCLACYVDERSKRFRAAADRALDEGCTAESFQRFMDAVSPGWRGASTAPSVATPDVCGVRAARAKFAALSSILDDACPNCGAAAGEPCKTLAERNEDGVQEMAGMGLAGPVGPAVDHQAREQADRLVEPLASPGLSTLAEPAAPGGSNPGGLDAGKGPEAAATVAPVAPTCASPSPSSPPWTATTRGPSMDSTALLVEQRDAGLVQIEALRRELAAEQERCSVACGSLAVAQAALVEERKRFVGRLDDLYATIKQRDAWQARAERAEAELAALRPPPAPAQAKVAPFCFGCGEHGCVCWRPAGAQ